MRERQVLALSESVGLSLGKAKDSEWGDLVLREADTSSKEWLVPALIVGFAELFGGLVAKLVLMIIRPVSARPSGEVGMLLSTVEIQSVWR